MKFFHGTTRENWLKIQEDGVLWGGHDPPEGHRHTYLTPDIEMARKYGDVVLEVDYEPQGAGSGVDNFGFDPPPGEECWQFVVFVPIDIRKVDERRTDSR